MQSAKSMFRRASKRLRRSTARKSEEQVAESSQDRVSETSSIGSESTGSAETSPLKEGVSPTLAASEIAAMAAKLSDSDSYSSTEAAAAPPAPVDAINQLFMKQRMELMYELRTIQNSHRPVSKGDQRRNIERFLRHHLHGDTLSSSSEGSHEGNSSPRRRRRNGVVVQELEGLSRQQSVTQRLQCSRFRQELENMVRGAVMRQEREVETALRLRPAGLPGNRRNPHGSEAGVGNGSQPRANSGQVNGVPVAPPPPPTPGQANWGHAAINQQGPQQVQQHVQQHMQQQAPQPQQREQVPVNNHWPAPTAPWLVQNSVSNNRGAPSGAQILQQAQRDAVISEISDLVHRQLVQETLESEFRGQLEFLMMNRLESTGTDGERVMNFIHSIPQSQQIRRNDFSHLGIQVNSGATTHADGAVGGAAVPAAFMQEMQSLRSRMNELHEMVRMSMEMQLDLQRAIRQEVSAALHQQNGTEPSTAAPVSEPASEGNCIICLDKEVDAVLYQCGHMCVCLTCGLRLSTMGSHCPMCRAPIRDVIRAYRCQRT